MTPLMTLPVKNVPVINATSHVTDPGCISFYRVPQSESAVIVFPATTDDESAFYALLPTLRRSHAGMFVAISGAKFWRAGTSRVALARQFFDEMGDDASVYIGYVGDEKPTLQATPFSVR